MTSSDLQWPFANCQHGNLTRNENQNKYILMTMLCIHADKKQYSTIIIIMTTEKLSVHLWVWHSDNLNLNRELCLYHACSFFSQKFEREPLLVIPLLWHIALNIRTVESHYNVPRLQRIHRYNVLLPKSRFHVMENSGSGYNVLSLQRTSIRPLGVL